MKEGGDGSAVPQSGTHRGRGLPGLPPYRRTNRTKPWADPLTQQYTLQG
jgi:hypothetical protein